MDELVQQLEDIENRVWDAHGYESRPNDARAWLESEAEMITLMIREIDLDAITDGVMDQITEDNYHSLALAVRCVRYLNQYAGEGKR